MSLPKARVERLKALGIDVEALIKAHNDAAEVDFVVPDGTLYTDAELTTRDNNTTATAEKAGEKKAIGIFSKELGKKLGVDIKGERVAEIANEVNELINKDGDDKIKLLQGQVTALTTDKTNLETQITGLNEQLSQSSEDMELISHFPATRGNDLSDTDRLMLLRRGLTIKTVDGKKIVEKDGVVLTNEKDKSPLSLKDAIAKEFESKPILMGTQAAPAGGGQGGRGAGDGGRSGGAPGAAPKKFSEAVVAWKAQDPVKNVNEMSTEFTTYVQTLAKADTTFNMYE